MYKVKDFGIQDLEGSENLLEWATAVWSRIQDMCYEQFLKDFKTVFEHPRDGYFSGELLCKLK